MDSRLGTGTWSRLWTVIWTASHDVLMRTDCLNCVNNGKNEMHCGF